MKFSIISFALASLVVASPQGAPEAQVVPQAVRESHFEIATNDCSAVYQDADGLVWSIKKDHREDLNHRKINLFSAKTGRPTRIEKHVKHDGKLVIKPHCHRDTFEIVNRFDKRVNVCIGEERRGNGHKKCKCEHLGPGDSITHHGDDTVSVNENKEDECAKGGLFELDRRSE